MGAPYNPRKIGEKQAKALKASLKKNGLVQPLIWNKRTGNIVGGHQRIEQLDSLARTQNYSLDVAVVDLDEKDEVALNITLNNTATMGEFDFPMVQQLAEEFKLDLSEDLLFNRDDLLVNFGMDLDDVPVQVQNANTDPEALQAIRDRKKLVREQYKEQDRQTTGHMNDRPVGTLTLVFRNEDQKQAFCHEHDMAPTTTSIMAEDILDLPEETTQPDPTAPKTMTTVLTADEWSEWERLKKHFACTSDHALILRLCRDTLT